MPTHLSLDALRARRRLLLGLLVPLLLLNWVGAAALPCVAMGVQTALESADAMTAEAIADHSHGAGHRAHDTAQAPSHPACPHCAHAQQGPGGDDAAAHAGCSEAPASTPTDSRRVPAKQDLGVAIPVAAQAIAAARAADVLATRDLNGVPPPTRALYLRHCVFLN